MKNKWSQKNIKFINQIVEEAKSKMFLRRWETRNYFVDDFNDANTKIGAQCSPDTQYEKASLYFYLPIQELIDKGDVTQVEEAVYHELIHLLTDELYNLAMARFTTEDDIIIAGERLTQRIARIICSNK